MALTNTTRQDPSQFQCPLLDRFLEESRGNMDTVYKLNCVINGVFSLAAVAANAVIIASIWRASSLRSPAYHLLLCLAVSDLGVGLLVQPIYIVYKVSGLYKHDHLNCIAGISFVLTSNQLSGVSLLTITLISVDRVLALYLHLRYNELVTLRRVKLTFIFTWILSAIANVLWITSLKVYYLIVSGGFAIFLITTLLVYVIVFRAVRKHRSKIKQQSITAFRLRRVSSHSQVKSNSEHNVTQETSDDRSAARFKKSAINMFIVYLIFLFCLLPLMCVMVVSAVHGRKTAVEIAFNFTMTLVFVNSSLNPLLYCLRMKELRKEVWNTLRSGLN